MEERNTIETASPDDKLILTAHWTSERWSLLARGTQYGEATRVFNFGGGFEPEQTYGSEWGVDLDVEFAVTKQFSVATGANNVLDEYPDLSSEDINFFGNLPYDVLRPITFNGAFYYLRTTYSFHARIHYHSASFRARSSAVEHYLDMVGVTGSIPVAPTIPGQRVTGTC